jgi:hypothetical protein
LVWRKEPYGGWSPAVPMIAKFCDVCRILGAISSYELWFGCSLARWTRIYKRDTTPWSWIFNFSWWKKITFSYSWNG